MRRQSSKRISPAGGFRGFRKCRGHFSLRRQGWRRYINCSVGVPADESTGSRHMCPGHAEFGPRALGHRSLLGDPRNPEMQTRMNVAIKFRESFRPLAPSVVEGKQSGYFDLTAESPYMLLVTPVREDKRCPLPPEKEKLTGLAKLKTVRSDLPAVTHRTNEWNLFTFTELAAEN